MLGTNAFAEAVPSSGPEGQYLLRASLSPASIPTTSFIDIDQQDPELLVIIILPKYIGERYALLVRSLGYRTLDDLAAVRECQISVLGGFGERRMSGIRDALTDHDLNFFDGPKADLTPQIEAMTARLSGRLGGHP